MNYYDIAGRRIFVFGNERLENMDKKQIIKNLETILETDLNTTLGDLPMDCLDSVQEAIELLKADKRKKKEDANK